VDTDITRKAFRLSVSNDLLVKTLLSPTPMHAALVWQIISKKVAERFWTSGKQLAIRLEVFRRSSAVEQATVNRLAVGSIPTAGANKLQKTFVT
jgi:hypothetical protein